MKTIGFILIAARSLFFIKTSFEMYLLTLMHGQQMLFFSLAHTESGLLWFVWLSGVFFVCLAVFAFLIVLLNLIGVLHYGKKYTRMRLVIQLVLVVHTTLLLTYHLWAAALFS